MTAVWAGVISGGWAVWILIFDPDLTLFRCLFLPQRGLSKTNFLAFIYLHTSKVVTNVMLAARFWHAKCCCWSVNQILWKVSYDTSFSVFKLKYRITFQVLLITYRILHGCSLESPAGLRIRVCWLSNLILGLKIKETVHLGLGLLNFGTLFHWTVNNVDTLKKQLDAHLFRLDFV